MKMHTLVMPSEREALFNGSGLGDLKGGAAPFFNTLLGRIFPSFTLFHAGAVNRCEFINLLHADAGASLQDIVIGKWIC